MAVRTRSSLVHPGGREHVSRPAWHSIDSAVNARWPCARDLDWSTLFRKSPRTHFTAHTSPPLLHPVPRTGHLPLRDWRRTADSNLAAPTTAPVAGANRDASRRGDRRCLRPMRLVRAGIHLVQAGGWTGGLLPGPLSHLSGCPLSVPLAGMGTHFLSKSWISYPPS